MLSDIFTSLITPCSPHLRSLGYLDETLDMRRRARLNRDAWQPHLENTKRFVLASAKKCGNRNKVVVLGSGLLLDIPLDELAGMFHEILLLDVICLPEVRRRIRRYHNVRFIEHDVSSVARDLYLSSGRSISELPEPAQAGLPENGNAGLVVSLNILSQLWVVPRAFIGKNHPGLDLEKVDEWCSRITEAHFAFLRSLPCDVCLIGDYEFVKRDRTGAVISNAPTIYGLSLPRRDETWTWDIAPITKANPHTSKELIVGAWHFAGR